MPLLSSGLVDQAKQVIREIEPDTLLQRLSDRPVVIDVREPDEYSQGSIPDAINIPRGILEFNLNQHPALNGDSHAVVTHSERPIYLYCGSGGRSALAAVSLLRMGFTNVWSLAGGLGAWESQGHPVARAAEKAY